MRDPRPPETPAHSDDARSDAELVDAARAGDERAFDVLYYRHRDWVARLARRFTGDDADALDVLQEVFAYLARRIGTLKLTARLTTLLYPAVKHRALELRRKRARAGGVGLDAAPDPPAATGAARSSADSRDALRSAIACLPEPQREAVLMRFLDGMTLEEIAAALAIPIGTVKSRLHHAIAALRADENIRDRLAP